MTRFSSRCGLSAETTKKRKELSGPCGEVAVIGVSTVVQLFQRKELPYRCRDGSFFWWFRDARNPRALWQRRLRARPNKIARKVGHPARTKRTQKRTNTWNIARSYILPAVPDR